MSEVNKIDVDALETQEWLQALESVVREEGVERAQYLLEQVLEQARLDGVDMPTGTTTNYVNTIPVDQFVCNAFIIDAYLVQYNTLSIVGGVAGLKYGN